MEDAAEMARQSEPGGGQTQLAGAQSTAADAAAGAPAAGERLPDFFLVGHQKCGSTALYAMIKDHPQIFMSEVKTPLFFASDLYSRRAPSGRLEEANRPRTLDAYLSLFAQAEEHQRVGEASHQYLRSAVAAEGIARLQPRARIVAILREPAGFLRSFHNEHVHNHSESEKDFRRALELEDARRRGERIPEGCRDPKALLYSEHVRFVEQLERLHAQFPREQVLVLIYDDFRADNVATVRKVLGFLEVDPDVPIETVETKRFMPVRSRRLQRASQKARRGLALAENEPQRAGSIARAANTLVPSPIRAALYRKVLRGAIYAKPPPPDEALLGQLRRRFKPEVVALSEYLDRDLVSLWGYDRIA